MYISCWDLVKLLHKLVFRTASTDRASFLLSFETCPGFLIPAHQDRNAFWQRLLKTCPLCHVFYCFFFFLSTLTQQISNHRGLTLGLQGINTRNRCKSMKVNDKAEHRAAKNKHLSDWLKSLQLSPFSWAAGDTASRSLWWSGLSHLQRHKRFEYSHSFTFSSTNRKKKQSPRSRCPFFPSSTRLCTAVLQPQNPNAAHSPAPGKSKRVRWDGRYVCHLHALHTHYTAPLGCRWPTALKKKRQLE